MTYKFLKTAIFSVSALALIVISSCTKSLPGRTDFTQTSDFVILQNGGLTNFGAVAYNRGSDTVLLTVRVDLASATNPAAPVTVNLVLDNAAITTYNTTHPAPAPQYVAIPAGNFKLLTTTLTIPAGQHYAETTLQVYTKGLNPATSYMTAISITDASGKSLSSNLNTLYFHTIGNPLAGVYIRDFYRRNSTTDTTGAPNSTVTLGEVLSVSPTGPTTLLFPESYMTTFVDPPNGISLDFTNNGGVLSNFTASLNTATLTNLANGGFTIGVAPVLVNATLRGNAANGYAGSTFRFYMSLVNSSGGIRTLIDSFTKQ
jgi:hypothetical protein